MSTQMSMTRRGVATEEMIQVSKDENVDLDIIVQRVANGSIIIPKNNDNEVLVVINVSMLFLSFLVDY
jgi:phosphomethylpyrimidine synthase